MSETHLQPSIETLIARYESENPRSKQLFERARKSLPGGNSRTGVHMDPFPIYAEKGEGVHLITADGRRLLDFVNNNTALILGHAHPDVVKALQDRIALGAGFSLPTALEVEMAELLKERIPSLERVRFCSSGTEAVLNALRVARAFTGKRKIAKFEGAYHGTDESALISYLPPLSANLGPPERPVSYPSSAGLSPSAADNVLVLPFNNPEACETLLREHARDLAAVIVDPLSTAAGLTLPENGFLNRLREITEQNGILLIFDEIVSFRVAPGGAQSLYNVRPDLTCLGKVVAGGTPGAAFGGRADILSAYNPADPQIPHSGTYNANPIALVAGSVTLRLLTPEAYGHLHDLTQRLKTDLAAAFSRAGLQVCITTTGSLFRVYFLPSPPRNYREAARDNRDLHRRFFFQLLHHNIYWKQGGNLSLPMQPEHIARLTDTIGTLLR